MLDKINEKLEKEIGKLLEKEELSFEEIKFLDDMRVKIELEKINKEFKEESEKKSKQWIETLAKLSSSF